MNVRSSGMSWKMGKKKTKNQKIKWEIQYNECEWNDFQHFWIDLLIKNGQIFPRFFLLIIFPVHIVFHIKFNSVGHAVLMKQCAECDCCVYCTVGAAWRWYFNYSPFFSASTSTSPVDLISLGVHFQHLL